MTPEQIDRILAEYETGRSSGADAELEALRAAVFLEDAFGIRLCDAEITPHRLGSAEAMRALVLSKLDAA